MESRDIEAAAARLQGKIHNIHVSSSQTFSKMSGCELYLKCENRQKTGSFKVRGAYNKLALLKERGLAPTIICESAGTQAEDAATLAKTYAAL